MNKKGFTLIELLAVVTIIAIISLIAIPNIFKGIKEQKNKISEANMKLLAAATDTYIQNNKKYDYSYEANGSVYCIPVQTLIDNKVLETPFKNTNGTEIDYSSQVKATYQAEYNSFNYELVDTCQEIKQYVSKPNLTENMIPVVYNEQANTWVKADKNSHWYNYSEKKWANAVLVKDMKGTEENSKNRYDYKEAPSGTPILESDILAYFTWIPRFRYELFESDEPTEINIIFENTSTPKSTGTSKNQWLTHPAFTYNNQELSGIWVGKYETSINNNILIKNNTPITNIDYVEANKKIIEMTNDNNVYGLKNVNTHMTRNSEWGALTYLTNSIYGNNQNNTTTGNITGIYNITGNKEFVILDNESENSLGYALSETNNWTTDNTYPTTENLYLTRGNNSIYNYQNSKVQDQNTTFRITLTNIESQNQNYQRKYVVTFDPDGGTLSETSKEVSYHEPYGSLPTPTREGYTFLGWHGKNIIDKLKSGVEEIANESPRTYWASSIFNNYWVVNNLKPDTQYSVSYNIEGISVPEYDSKYSGNLGIILYSQNSDKTTYPTRYMMDGNGYYISTGEKIYITKTITTPSNVNLPESKYLIYAYSNRYEKDGTGVYSTIRLYNLQLEEGDTATEYEPYYITPTTTVVQQKNHTLKAIWQANS